MTDPASVYWAARATLVHRPEDIEVFDHRVHRVLAQQRERRSDPRPSRGTHAARPRRRIRTTTRRATTDRPDDARHRRALQPAGDAAGQGLRGLLTRRDGRVASSDWPDCVSAARGGGPAGCGRRRRPVGRPDLRRTVQAALKTGGEPIHRRYRAPRRAAAPARPAHRRQRQHGALRHGRSCGSPTPRSSAAARSRHSPSVLASAASRGELTWHDPDGALASAAAAVVDWSGGTRLGDDLRAFNDRWGRPGWPVVRDVVILSDGWDRGDPELLGERDGALAPGRPPDRVGQPVEGRAGLRSRWLGAWPPRSRTSTSSLRAMRWHPWSI